MGRDRVTLLQDYDSGNIAESEVRARFRNGASPFFFVLPSLLAEDVKRFQNDADGQEPVTSSPSARIMRGQACFSGE